MPNLFCFGLSYTATALITELRRRDGPAAWHIVATCRDEEGQKACTDMAISPVNYGSEASKAALLSSDFILSSIPPGKSGDPVLQDYGQTLATCHPTWAAYLSTTGPYGDCDGDWVDETSPDHPSGPRGQKRLDAETQWRGLAQDANLPLHIFRLPGLYGPGRSPLDRVRDGTARRIVKEAQVFSRIHIDDLAAILAASMSQPRPGALYPVADDLPAPPQDVVSFAAELLGMQPPPEIAFDEADLSPMAKSFYADNKRISNALIKRELGITLTYPTYKEGLRAILESET